MPEFPLDRASDQPSPGYGPGAGPYDRIAEIFRLVAEPTRLRILVLLAGREHPVSELIAGFPGVEGQLISRHLAVLRRGGLAGSRKQGASRIYGLTPVGILVVRAIRRHGLT